MLTLDKNSDSSTFLLNSEKETKKITEPYVIVKERRFFKKNLEGKLTMLSTAKN